MNKIFYKKPFDFFINKIKNDEYFKYSRFNDGEIIAINGKSTNSGNCDNHRYFPEMGEELKEILVNFTPSDNYFLESFDYWYNHSGLVKNVIDELKQVNSNLEFLNTDFIRIMHETKPDKFNEFLDILKTKKIVVVGPNYLKKLDKHFDFKFIEVPLVNCYTEKDRIINDMEKIIEGENDFVFLLSASMPANIIIDHFTDNKNTYLDWGSVWDTFFNSAEYPFIKKRSTSDKDIIINNYKKYLI